MVYYGGTGRAVFLGMLRLTTIFLFGGACVIAAPACYADEEKKWLTPLGKNRVATPDIRVSVLIYTQLFSAVPFQWSSSPT